MGGRRRACDARANAAVRQLTIDQTDYRHTMTSTAPRPTSTPRRAPTPAHDRRRPRWREFRHAYPGILATMGLAVVLLLAIDGWLIYKRVKYQREITRLRAGMTSVERHRLDVELASAERKVQMIVELARRQALGDVNLHLSVAVDSGMMHLAREGAVLRDMRVVVGPERLVGTPPDTVQMVAPRGTRTIERVLEGNASWEVPRWVYADRGVAVPEDRTLRGALGPAALLLNGGTVVYTMPTVGPLNDSSYVMPGSIRARTEDLSAVLPNLKPGMTVYFY